MILKFDNSPSVDTELIDTVEPTNDEKRILNDNLLELI